MTTNPGIIASSEGTLASSVLPHSPNTDSRQTATFSYILDDGSDNQLDTSKCGILSCWWIKRYKCHLCQCFRSKSGDLNRTAIPFTPPSGRWRSGSTDQSLTGLSRAAGDSATANLTDILPQGNSEPSFEFTQSTLPTTLNEAFKQFFRIFQKIALPSTSDRQSFSPQNSTQRNENEPDKHRQTVTNFESLQKGESRAELATKSTVCTMIPPTIPPQKGLVSKNVATSVSMSEGKTPSSGLLTNTNWDGIIETSATFQTPITCHTLPFDSKQSTEIGRIESSSFLSSTASMVAKVTSGSYRQCSRRSQSLTSSVSQSRRSQWRELERALSVCSLKTSSQTDRAIAQGTNKDSVTTSEEEMAELLSDALQEIVNHSCAKNGEEVETSYITKSEADDLTVGTGRDTSVQFKSSVSFRTRSVQSPNSLDTMITVISTPPRHPSKPGGKSDKFIQSERFTSYSQSPIATCRTPGRIDLHRKKVTTTCVWNHRIPMKFVTCERNARLPPVYGDTCGNNSPFRRPRRFTKVQKNLQKLGPRNSLSAMRSMANLVPPKNSSVRREMPTEFLQTQNANESGLKLRESTRCTSYSEQFRLRRRLASGSAQPVRMNVRIPNYMRLNADDNETTCSIGTARILALAETSDLLEEGSISSFEKELHRFCFGASDHETENKDDNKPEKQRTKSRCVGESANQSTVELVPKSELVQMNYPYYQVPGISTDRLWFSIRPTASILTVPNNAILTDYRIQEAQLEPTSLLLQAARPWTVCMPTGWVNTFNPCTQMQAPEPIFHHQYQPPSPAPTPVSSYLSLAAYPYDVHSTQRSIKTPSLDQTASRTTLRVS